MKQRFLYVIGLTILLNINLFGARDYSPETGRWTAEDPIGFWSGDINFYTYCANDPVNYIDPSGLSKEGKDGLRENEQNTLPIKVFSAKAPMQVKPGTKSLSGHYINNLGKIQPWRAAYDKFGRLMERTDWNAGNRAAGIPARHHHTRQYLPKGQIKRTDHIPGGGPLTGR